MHDILVQKTQIKHSLVILTELFELAQLLIVGSETDKVVLGGGFAVFRRFVAVHSGSGRHL